MAKRVRVRLRGWGVPGKPSAAYQNYYESISVTHARIGGELVARAAIDWRMYPNDDTIEVSLSLETATMLALQGWVVPRD